MNSHPLDEFCSIQLTIIGISFSIFTILYSFILGKRETLETIANKIKLGDKSPQLKGHEHYCLTSIKRLKYLNIGAIVICTASIFLLIIMELVKATSCSKLLIDTLKFLNYVEFLSIILLILLIFKKYFDDVKIE